MKGLTPEQLIEITAFVQKHHKFGYVPDEDRVTEHSFGIKYIDATYDSRDKTYWNITFRSGSSGVCFATNHFTALSLPPKGWEYNTIYDLCMAYLTGVFKPKEEFYINERNPREAERDSLDMLYKEMQERLKYLEIANGDEHADANLNEERIKELTLAIVRVQQILLLKL